MKKTSRTFALIMAAACIACATFANSLYAQTSAPAAAPTPTLEQRVSGLEAYLNNTDPTASLKDKDGNVPRDLTTPSVGVSGPGHNAWQMTCAALVLFMTLPGLFLFYGGLVRRKNVLSVCAQCYMLAGLVTILWWAVGYSFTFSTGSPFLGDLSFKFLHGVTSAPNANYSSWVSQNVFSMYQLMFAIITPALIIGAIAERMKFSAMILFMTAWMFIVYFPLAHMVWGVDGFMNGVWNPHAGVKAMDFAGGTVVHMSSGWSALILCLIVGKRTGFGKEPMPPHSMVLVAIGTGMLWVGWYGFNAGSALAADGIAANAFTTTTLATAVASFVWPMAEYLHKGKPSILGFCSGAVAGLVVITPACGFVNTTGAVIIGVIAALIPFFFVVKVKSWFGYDDALDTFGVHAVGGTIGAFLTGILADPAINSNIARTTPANPATLNGLADAILHHTAWLEQLKAMGITLMLAITGTVIIGFLLKATIGLRPTVEQESQGLDVSNHGEEGYILE
ncbi:MAG: ammonium transporter [Chthoniobacteraceae bacterium]